MVQIYNSFVSLFMAACEDFAVDRVSAVNLRGQNKAKYTKSGRFCIIQMMVTQIVICPDAMHCQLHQTACH